MDDLSKLIKVVETIASDRYHGGLTISKNVEELWEITFTEKYEFQNGYLMRNPTGKSFSTLQEALIATIRIEKINARKRMAGLQEFTKKMSW